MKTRINASEREIVQRVRTWERRSLSRQERATRWEKDVVARICLVCALSLVPVASATNPAVAESPISEADPRSLASTPEYAADLERASLSDVAAAPITRAELRVLSIKAIETGVSEGGNWDFRFTSRKDSGVYLNVEPAKFPKDLAVADPRWRAAAFQVITGTDKEPTVKLLAEGSYQHGGIGYDLGDWIGLVDKHEQRITQFINISVPRPDKDPTEVPVVLDENSGSAAGSFIVTFKVQPFRRLPEGSGDDLRKGPNHSPWANFPWTGGAIVTAALITTIGGWLGWLWKGRGGVKSDAT